MATRSLYLSTFYFFGLSCFFLHSLLTFFISFTFYCNQKRRSAQNTHKYPSDLPGTPAHSLHVTNSLLHPWLATTQGLLCRTSTMHLHGQTSRTDTNPLHKINFWSFYFTENTPTSQASRLCLHLIYPTVPKSEARTCRLLIAAEENTSNPTLQNLHQAPPIFLHTHNFSAPKSAPLSTVAGLHLKLASSHHFLPYLINEAPQILIHLAAKHPCIPCKPNLSPH